MFQINNSPARNFRTSERQSRNKINQTNIYQNAKVHHDKDQLNDGVTTSIKSSDFVTPQNIPASNSILMSEMSNSNHLSLRKNLPLQNTSFVTDRAPQNHSGQNSSFLSSSQVLSNNLKDYKTRALQDSLQLTTQMNQKTSNINSPRR